jgi:hypothetical protein
VYGYWRAWKWLYKQAEAANDAEFLGPMMARLDAIPLYGNSSSDKKKNPLSDRQLNDVEVRGNLACATVAGNWRETPKLFVLDVSDPLSPQSQGSLEIAEAAAVVPDGNYAYVLAFSRYRAQGGLRVVNISDPKTPVLVGSLECGDAARLKVQNGFAYVLEMKNPAVRAAFAW